MRVISKDRDHFHGTHKGHEIYIEREKPLAAQPAWDFAGSSFYITVTSKSGEYAYDGYAPPEIRTMRAAKREALAGACLYNPVEE